MGAHAGVEIRVSVKKRGPATSDVGAGMLVDRFFRSPLYPAVLRWPMLAATAVLVFLLLLPPRHSEMNVGAAVVWQLWWAALPFAALLTARTWCAICPFPFVGELLRRLRPSPGGLPSPSVRTLIAWLAPVILALLGLLFLLLALESNGAATAALLMLFAVAAAASALVWRGLVWCRYICPVGLLLGLYSRLSWLRLEPVGDSKTVAMAGSKACHLFTSPLSSRRSQDCTLCAGCMKVPGGELVRPGFTRPSLDRQILARPEAVAVTLLLGLLLADALRMVPWYLRYMAWTVGQLGWSYDEAVAAGIAAIVLASLTIPAVLAAVPGGRKDPWTRLTGLSLALLPIVLATQLALSTQHLMAVGEVLRNLGAEAGLLGPGHMPPANAYSVVWPIKVLQAAVLAVGAAVSLRMTVRHPGGWRCAPAIVVIVLAFVLLGIFVQPMSVTC